MRLRVCEGVFVCVSVIQRVYKCVCRPPKALNSIRCRPNSSAYRSTMSPACLQVNDFKKNKKKRERERERKNSAQCAVGVCACVCGQATCLPTVLSNCRTAEATSQCGDCGLLAIWTRSTVLSFNAPFWAISHTSIFLHTFLWPHSSLIQSATKRNGGFHNGWLFLGNEQNMWQRTELDQYIYLRISACGGKNYRPPPPNIPGLFNTYNSKFIQQNSIMLPQLRQVFGPKFQKCVCIKKSEKKGKQPSSWIIQRRSERLSDCMAG